jgi:hypothetical protein
MHHCPACVAPNVSVASTQGTHSDSLTPQWSHLLPRLGMCTDPAPACVQMIHETHYLLFAVAFTHIIYTCATLYLSLFRVGVKRFCLCAASAEQWVSCLPKRLSSPHCRCQQDHRPWCRSSSSRTTSDTKSTASVLQYLSLASRSLCRWLGGTSGSGLLVTESLWTSVQPTSLAAWGVTRQVSLDHPSLITVIRKLLGEHGVACLLLARTIVACAAYGMQGQQQQR